MIFPILLNNLAKLRLNRLRASFSFGFMHLAFGE
jgi:hypothetical protein